MRTVGPRASRSRLQAPARRCPRPSRSAPDPASASRAGHDGRDFFGRPAWRRQQPGLALADLGRPAPRIFRRGDLPSVDGPELIDQVGLYVGPAATPSPARARSCLRRERFSVRRGTARSARRLLRLRLRPERGMTVTKSRDRRRRLLDDGVEWNPRTPPRTSTGARIRFRAPRPSRRWTAIADRQGRCASGSSSPRRSRAAGRRSRGSRLATLRPNAVVLTPKLPPTESSFSGSGGVRKQCHLARRSRWSEAEPAGPSPQIATMRPKFQYTALRRTVRGVESRCGSTAPLRTGWPSPGACVFECGHGSLRLTAEGLRREPRPPRQVVRSRFRNRVASSLGGP